MLTPLVLIVDDQPDLLKALALTLESAGYRIMTAGNGLEALAMLRTQPADLILSDISMPYMNGLQFYEQVRRNPCWETIPFLFLTAWFPIHDVPGASHLTIDDCLIKPVQPEDLLRVVECKLCEQYAMA
jgi:CheY-like chemotaxis protein